MWSFIASVIVFIALVVILRLWQRSRRQEVAVVDQQIHDVAEVAQRRHVQRFGRANTDLANTFNGSATSKS